VNENSAEAKLERAANLLWSYAKEGRMHGLPEGDLYVLLESLAAAFEDWQEPPIDNLSPAGWTAGCCVRAATEVLSVLEPQVFKGEAWTCLPCLKAMPEGGRTFRLILCKEQAEVLGCGGPGEDAVHVRYQIEVLK